jgi:hypothetical protein
MNEEIRVNSVSEMWHHRLKIHRLQRVGPVAHPRGEQGQDHQHARKGTGPQSAQLVRGRGTFPRNQTGTLVRNFEIFDARGPRLNFGSLLMVHLLFLSTNTKSSYISEFGLFGEFRVVLVG